MGGGDNDGGGDRHIYNKKQTVNRALSAEGESWERAQESRGM